MCNTLHASERLVYLWSLWRVINIKRALYAVEIPQLRFNCVHWINSIQLYCNNIVFSYYSITAAIILCLHWRPCPAHRQPSCGVGFIIIIYRMTVSINICGDYLECVSGVFGRVINGRVWVARGDEGTTSEAVNNIEHQTKREEEQEQEREQKQWALPFKHYWDKWQILAKINKGRAEK